MGGKGARGNFVIDDDFLKNAKSFEKGKGKEKEIADGGGLKVFVSPWDRSTEYWNEEFERKKLELIKCGDVERSGAKADWPEVLVRK
jgi:hypothetical protein